MKLCADKDCCSCGLCVNICPTQSITMEIAEDGFYRPHIDTAACVDCGKCDPEKMFATGEYKHNVQKVYAAKSNDKEIYYKGTSGGVATILSKYFFESDNCVNGCFLDKDLMPEHRLCKTKKDIQRLQGSKYVYSSPGRIYHEIKAKLRQGKKCLFIGLPCQVYACRQTCKAAENLTTIDLLCHGGASPKYYREHIQYLKKKFKVDADNVSFRGGEHDCWLTLYHEEAAVLKRGQYYDEYFLAFMEHVIFNPACFSCKYTGAERVGDLTLGDFWGLDKEVERNEGFTNGVSLILVNTTKGQELLEECARGQLTIVPRTLEEAVEGNETLKASTPVPKNYEKINRQFKKWGLEKTMHRTHREMYIKHWLVSCWFGKLILRTKKTIRTIRNVENNDEKI